MLGDALQDDEAVVAALLGLGMFSCRNGEET